MLDLAGAAPDTLLSAPCADGLPLVVSVVRDAISTDLSLNQYRDLSLDPATAALSGYGQPLGQPKPSRALAGEHALTLDRVGTARGKRIRQRQVLAVRDGVGYTITYTAPAGDFGAHTAEFVAMLDSWRWR